MQTCRPTLDAGFFQLTCRSSLILWSWCPL